jgi:hypothetical protein
MVLNFFGIGISVGGERERVVMSRLCLTTFLQAVFLNSYPALIFDKIPVFFL